MIAGLIARGQEIIAESLILTSDQLTGSYLRRDLNDRLAALVKVQIPLGGVEFEGDTLGNIEVHAGEYFVFMPEGSQRLRVKVPGHYPSMVTFREINPSIPDLESARVYELRLRSTAAAPSPSNVGEQANYAIFTIKPENAVLSVDGQPVSVINGRARAYLPVGQHRYHAEAPGHISSDNTFRISTADKTLISISLRSQHAVLNLSCPTPGVEFFINDQKASAVNLLMPGLYHVEARKDGAVSSVDVRLKAEEIKNITIPAITKPTGSINVDVLPIGAEIYIDNKLVGKSPELLRNMPAKSYKLEFRAPGYENQTCYFILDANTTQTVKLQLKPIEKKYSGNAKPLFEADTSDFEFVFTTRKGQQIYPADAIPKSSWDSYCQGIGFTVGMKYIVLCKDCRSNSLSVGELTKAMLNSLPTEAVMKFIKDHYHNITAAFEKAGLKPIIIPGTYWYKTGTGVKSMEIGGGKASVPGEALVVEVRYSGTRDNLTPEAFGAHPLVWNGDLQVVDPKSKTKEYIGIKEYRDYNPITKGFIPRGIYVRGRGILPLADYSSHDATSLGKGARYAHAPSPADCDTINKHLDFYNKLLKGFGGDTIVVGEPYWTYEGAIDENNAGAYYFGTGPESGRQVVPKTTIAHSRRLLPIDINPSDGVFQEPTLRTTPKDMDLMTVWNGNYYFFSPEEWEKISYERKNVYGIIGLVVEDSNSWFVIGRQTYNAGPYSTAKYFGQTLPSPEQATTIGRKLGAIKEAQTLLGQGAFRFIDLEQPYWLNDGRHITFYYTPENGASGSTTSNSSISSGAMRQIVMTWAKTDTAMDADLLLRETETSANIKLIPTSAHDTKTYWMNERIWRNLPESQTIRFTPQR